MSAAVGAAGGGECGHGPCRCERGEASWPGHRAIVPAEAGGAQRGSATAELVLATPALLFILMLVVQFGLWYHADHVAGAAAQEAAAAARVLGGTEADGEARGDRFLAEVGGRLIPDGRTRVELTADSARAVATGHVTAVVPFLRLAVEGVSEGPRERFLAPPSP